MVQKRSAFFTATLWATLSMGFVSCHGSSVLETDGAELNSSQTQSVNSTTSSCEALPPLKTSRSLFISDWTILSQTLTFQSAMEAISNTEDSYFQSPLARARSFFHTWHDSNSPKETGLFSPDNFPHCDDELDADNHPVMNGHVLECPRNESVFANRQQVNPFNGTGIQSVFIPLSVVNRFDLTPTDYSTCGEVRVVFGLRNAPVPMGRHLIILEAAIPNPQPGCVNRCRAYAQEWASLSAIDTNTVEGKAETAQKLKQFLFEGIAGFPAALKWEHFSQNHGHVRTNSFASVPGVIGSSWILRQYQLERRSYKGLVDAEGLPTTPNINSFGLYPAQGYHIVAVPQPVSDVPAVEWVSNAMNTPKAQAFASHFISQSMPQLAPNVTLDPNVPQDLVNYIRASVLPEHTAAESRTETTANTALPNASLMVAHQFSNLASPEFRALITAAIPPGSNLTATHYLNRMSLNSCAGCHHGVLVGELSPGALYQKDLRFFHVNSVTRIPCERIDGQQGTVNNCFEPSNVLRESFLPHRMKLLQQFTATHTTCGACDADAMVATGTATKTIGGQPMGAH